MKIGNDIYSKDYLVSRIICSGKEIDGYSKVYYRTNEDLCEIYSDLDFKDKKVLSVLASTDHVYTARYLGASKVDSFDKNRLALYYYYLRKWIIKYSDLILPNILNGNQFLRKLLKIVKVESEEEAKALDFFREHCKNNTNLSNLFFDDYMDKEKGKTLYQSNSELKELIDQDMKFTNFDLFVPNRLKDKYDYVLISNILEWGRGDISKLEIASENLNNVLNSNGVVICSRLIDRTDESIEREKRIFDSNFTREDYKTGYVYKKRG